MSRYNRIVAFVTIIVFLIASTNGATTVNAQAMDQNQVLKVAFLQDPISLNGIVKTWNPVGYTDAFILLKLVTYSPNFTIVGEAAQSWDTSSDGKSITFHLRQDVVWADGQPFTSADVAWHYRMMLNGTSVTKSQLTDLTGISTPDKYTVTFTFAKTRNYFNLIIPFGLFSTGADQFILPSHLYQGVANFADNPVNTMMVGDGAFTVKQFVSGQYLDMVPNPHYFGPKPKASEVIFSFPYTPSSASTALEGGRVDIVHDSVGIALPDLARFRNQTGISAEGWPYTTTWRMTFNFHAAGQYPWINNKLVRQAFSRAVDRDTIIKTVLGGLTVPEYGPISVTDKAWYDPQISKYTYDPAMANSLLDQAGYPKGSDGTRFSAPMVVYLSSLPFAQVIQQQLLAVGIKLTVTPVEDVTFFAQYETGPRGLDTYPIGLQTFGAGPLPANMFAWSNAAKFSPKGQNCGFYNNTQVNQLEDQADSTLDTNQAHQLVNQVQEIISADVGYVFLWAHWKIVAFKSNIAGVIQNSLPISWYGPGYRDVYRTGTSSMTSSTSMAQQTGLTSTMPTIAIIIVVLLVVAGAVIAKRKKKTPSS